MTSELVKQDLPVAVQPSVERMDGPVDARDLTPAQAKVDAVAALTMSAYQRASQLVLTDDEIAALTADFPDEAFKPGAAGKENLIYIEHAYLRDRLNSVFRPGQWAIVPRNRWAEDFKTQKGVDGSRVYVEAMLCIRGCFAAEAVGEMEYYPSNGSQNYGDCVEGAKTAALRRCCKEVGIGLQAWKKDWCEGWWKRRRSGSRTPAPVTTLKPNGGASNKPREATDETKRWMFDQFEKAGFAHAPLEDYAKKNGILLDTEVLSDWPLIKVPTSKEALETMKRSIDLFLSGGEPPKTNTAPISVGSVREYDEPEDGVPYDEDEWRKFTMPFGKHAGTKLEDLDKKYLYGLWANYAVEKEFNGKPRPEAIIQKDRQFRAYLDDAGKHYEFKD